MVDQGCFVLVEREALCPWTSNSATELARMEHSCELIFICIAASWGHEMRPRERQWRTDYKGRVRSNDRGGRRESSQRRDIWHRDKGSQFSSSRKAGTLGEHITEDPDFITSEQHGRCKRWNSGWNCLWQRKETACPVIVNRDWPLAKNRFKDTAAQLNVIPKSR